MFNIKKEFQFDAAHQLMGLPPTHPCTRLHGHTYTVIIELESPVLRDPGFISDYRDLAEIKNWLDKEFDHRNLNDVIPLNPTAELIAMFIYERWKPDYPELKAVSVKETPKTIATYYEG